MTDREIMQQALCALTESKPIDPQDNAAFVRSTKAIEALIKALAQPEREWVGLTLEERQYLNDVLNLNGRFTIIHAIEAKLKEKNA